MPGGGLTQLSADVSDYLVMVGIDPGAISSSLQDGRFTSASSVEAEYRCLPGR